jgi:hypothetical protein
MGESIESVENRGKWNDSTMSQPPSRAGVVTTHVVRTKNHSEVKMGCGKNMSKMKPEYET